jgi:hypothetical protein
VSPWKDTRWDDPGECDALEPQQDPWPELDEQAIILTGPDRAGIRAALCASSQILAWARQHGGPAVRGAVNDIASTRPAAAGTLEYDINLYIDCLDFATPAIQRITRAREV